jgi:DNA modification methylase
MTTKKNPVLDISTLPIVSTIGSLWLLDHHRLLCGDSTDLKQVERLINHEKADMAFIDPPYNVGYTDGAYTPREALQNDALSAEDYAKFVQQLAAAHRFALKRGASLYWCCSTSQQAVCVQALEANDYTVRTHIIWAKNHFVLSFARYKNQHEVIIYSHRADERDPWYGDKKQTTVWNITKPAVNKLHPTQKPIALIEKALINSCKKDDVVLDLCSGAGSTLMACVKLERSARLMEIVPSYVDATIHRWQLATQQQAVLWPDNISFNELLTQKQHSD